MKKSFCALSIALLSGAALAQGAPETKDIDYRRFVEAFHLEDFLENKSDVTSVIRFQYVLTPENKALSWPHWPLKLRVSSSQAEGAKVAAGVRLDSPA